jgi:hypothetical protein
MRRINSADAGLFRFQIKDDIKAARRRLRRHITDMLRKPTTQPTQIAL